MEMEITRVEVATSNPLFPTLEVEALKQHVTHVRQDVC